MLIEINSFDQNELIIRQEKKTYNWMIVVDKINENQVDEGKTIGFQINPMYNKLKSEMKIKSKNKH